jgi:acyl-CoA reductase-like NAD-dependent aldehyde dehydrogenase
VVLAGERWPLPAITLAEVLDTADLPGGVINVLTGITAELVPFLAGHMDVNALDITGVKEHLRPEIEALCADNVKRVVRVDGDDWLSDRAQSPYAVTALMEMKTVWHPMGA